MSVPGIVHSTLDGEEIAARVALGSDNELFITSSSTLVYRSDGLLSDESVDQFPHDADRLTISEGRRKTKFTLEYPLEGTKEFSVPSDKTDDVLHPVLAGVLNGNGITDPGETVVQTYRFSELTLIITSDRLVKHIGAAVWDSDYEEYHFSDVTNLAFEDGSVATQIVLTVAGRPQRIKAPNEQANDLRERLKRALFEYHDVASLEELNETIGVDDDDDPADDGGASVDFGDGVDPLDANPPEPDDQDVVEPTESAGAAGDAGSTDPLATDPMASTSDPEPTGNDATAGRTQPVAEQPDEQANARTQHDQQNRPDQQPSGDTPSQGQTQSASNVGQTNAETDEVDTTFGADRDVSESTPEPESTDTAEYDADSSLDGADILGESVTGISGDIGGSDADDHGHDVAELADRIESLEAAVDRQTELIERQQRTIEQLIAELQKSS